MKKDKIKKLIIIFLAAETILLVAISYNAYRTSIDLKNNRLFFLSAVYYDLQRDLRRAEQVDFVDWRETANDTASIYLDSGAYADEADDQRLITQVLYYAYSAYNPDKEEQAFLSELKDMEVSVQGGDKWYVKRKIVFMDEPDRDKVERFLREKDLW